VEALIEQYLGNPLILAVLLFLANFVMEEGAIIAGAALAAAGEIGTGLALVALVTGNIVSDWALYGIGALAGSSPLVRRWVDGKMLERGRRLLDRGVLPAALLARLLPPVFMASGFVRVDFRRFAIVNGVVAAVYTAALFFGAFGLNLVLFDLLGNWAWPVMVGLVIGVVWLSHRFTVYYFASDKDEGGNSGD
jgi:membrane protein DedA with SNARE-associated domain